MSREFLGISSGITAEIDLTHRARFGFSRKGERVSCRVGNLRQMSYESPYKYPSEEWMQETRELLKQMSSKAILPKRMLK